MSSLLETIADELALDALKAEEDLEDETIPDQVAKAIAVASPTFQEAFTTAVRMRRAEQRGRKELRSILARSNRIEGPKDND